MYVMMINFNLKLIRTTSMNSDTNKIHKGQKNGERNFLSININPSQRFNKNKIKLFKLKLFISKCA